MGGRGSYSKTRSGGKGSTGRRGKVKPMDLTQFDGMTLKDIEDYARKLDHEQMFVFDKDGKLIRAYDGNKGSVSFNGADLFIKDAVMTHNHPGEGEGYGGTFSPADIMNMAASNWAESRAAASGQGEYNYIARRTSKTTAQNSRDLFNRVNRDRADLNRQMSEAYKKADKNLSAKAKRQIYTGIFDRYWSTVLPQYNFEYISKNRSYNYTQTKR